MDMRCIQSSVTDNGTDEGKPLQLIPGCALLLPVLWPLVDGIKALGYQMMSNLIASALVSIASATVFAL